MTRLTASLIPFFCLLWWMLLAAAPLKAEGDDALGRTIRMPGGKATVYQLLEQVADRCGYLFIYDSNLMDNDRKVRFKAGAYTVRRAIAAITGDAALQLRVVGNHILIYQKETPPLPAPEPVQAEAEKDSFLTIEGVIVNRSDHTPVPYASIGITEMAIGTVSNLNGQFRFLLPDSLSHAPVLFSHVGFVPQSVESSLLAGGRPVIRLEPKVVPLQEVVVRNVDPLKLINSMLEGREGNYAKTPVYHTTFYREGIMLKKDLTALTEAVFKIYKTPYDTSPRDQVKLLKMRRIVNREEKDTLMTKFKSGINACLMLDVVKYLPDFISPESRFLYDYVHSDMTEINNRRTNVVSFGQKKGHSFPLYRGELYIDSENSALLTARFEVNPKYVEKSAGMFVEKKSKDLSITPRKVTYTVSYKPWNGVYYIDHVRGDLHFKVLKKKRLFSTSLHIWFEMAICKTETAGATPFRPGETIPAYTVFSETRFTYDQNFWQGFNIILPEENLNEAIRHLSAKIEETGY